MFHSRSFYSFAICLLLSIAPLSCSTPQYIWPQGDIQMAEVNEPTAGKKVLVASRSSEFKDAIVGKIKAALEGEAVYVKFIGVDQLDPRPVQIRMVILDAAAGPAGRPGNFHRGMLQQHPQRLAAHVSRCPDDAGSQHGCYLA